MKKKQFKRHKKEPIIRMNVKLEPATLKIDEQEIKEVFKLLPKQIQYGKIEQLIYELENIPAPIGSPYGTYQEGWLDAMRLVVRKFEKLLEEVKKQ